MRVHENPKMNSATANVEDIVDADNVSFVSMAPLACFKQISVTIQDTEICDLSTHTYPFRCVMDVTCSFSPGVKKQLYESAFYTAETEGKEANLVADANDTSAFNVRKKMLKPVTKPKPFRTDLHVEMFNTQRLLVSLFLL